MRFKLGKRPARPGAIKLKFGTFFDAKALPVPPKVFGHESIGKPWGMLANDQVSNCVFAGAAHESMVWARSGGRAIPKFTDQNVIADYSILTGFDPAKPETDQGTDMQEAAKYRQKVGILDASGVRHKIDAYVSIRGWDDLVLATYLFGAAGVGLELPVGSDNLFDAQKPWAGKPGKDIEGGHYVPAVGRNSADNLLVVTWGRLQAIDRDFFEAACDEAVAYLSLDALRNKVSPEGFDYAGLKSALARLAA